jgi:hypothetical protein
MHLRRIKSRNELLSCIEISSSYIKDNPSAFEINEIYARQELGKMYKNNDYFFVVIDNDAVIGWITAVRAPLFYWSPTVSLNLIVYHTSIKTPIKSVKIFKLVFQHLVQYAKSRKISVVKANSMLSSNNTFNRILESMGWESYGDMLIFNTRKDE